MAQARQQGDSNGSSGRPRASETAGDDAHQSWEQAVSQGAAAAQEGINQLIRAGRAATDATTKALQSVDFEGVGESMSHALSELASASLPKLPQSSPYIVNDKGASSRGTLKLAGGLLLLISLGVPVLLAGIVGLIQPGLFTVVLLLLGVALVVVGTRLVRGGFEERELARTLKRVSRAASTSVKLQIDELSARVGVAAPKLRLLLARGIDKGLLPQGRIVEANGQGTLYLTNEAYQTDVAAAFEGQRQQRAAQMRAKAEAATAATDASLPEDARRVVTACGSYVETATAAAPELLDAHTRELSLELAHKVDKVAKRVRRSPGLAPSLERYASYYLPTAAKMVRMAAELDREGAQGQNATEAREQVAGTLEMLCDATAKLLDDLFAERAWDVSADAGVMRTMLRQDGLADDGGISAACGPAAVSGPAAANGSTPARGPASTHDSA